MAFISHYAKMVSFAGWDMPMNYEAGIKAEHLATRHEAGLFDVSHMAQITLAGKNAGKRRCLRQANKYWPPVARVDNAFGDRHLICSCPLLEEWQEAAE